MAEYNAGSIEADLELNRDPFEAGLAIATQEGEAFERKPLVKKVEVKPDTGSLLVAQGILQRLANADPVEIPLRLSGLPRGVLNALASQLGMRFGTAVAYDTKTQLIGALSDRGYLNEVLAAAAAGGAGGGDKKGRGADTGAGAGPTGWLLSLLSGGGLTAVGLSIPHLFLSVIPLAVSAAAAAIGGLTAAIGAAGVAAVGMGTDLAGIGQASRDIRTVSGDMNNLSRAVAVYGQNSLQAQTAQQQLNYDLQSFNPIARSAVVAAAATAGSVKSMFDQYTGYAEATGARIITQLLNTSKSYIPIIGQFATQNMMIIQQGLQPFIRWLTDPYQWGGISIFTSLEQTFQKDLPTGINLAEQSFELFAKTIQVASGFSGGLLQKIDDFVTKWNGVDFGRWAAEEQRLFGIFEVWVHFGTAAFHTIGDLLHLEAGTGTALIQYLTMGLQHLNAWLTGPSGVMMHNLFEAHKEQLLSLLHTVGIFIATAGPPLIQLLTTIARESSPLLPIFARVLSPFVAALADLINVILKIPAIGPFLSLLLVIRGFQAIPWLGIGAGIGVFLRPIERLIAIPVDAAIGKLLKLAATIPLVNRALLAAGANASKGSILSTLFGSKSQAAKDAEDAAKAAGQETTAIEKQSGAMVLLSGVLGPLRDKLVAAGTALRAWVGNLAAAAYESGLISEASFGLLGPIGLVGAAVGAGILVWAHYAIAANQAGIAAQGATISLADAAEKAIKQGNVSQLLSIIKQLQAINLGKGETVPQYSRTGTIIGVIHTQASQAQVALDKLIGRLIDFGVTQAEVKRRTDETAAAFRKWEAGASTSTGVTNTMVSTLQSVGGALQKLGTGFATFTAAQPQRYAAMISNLNIQNRTLTGWAADAQQLMMRPGLGALNMGAMVREVANEAPADLATMVHLTKGQLTQMAIAFQQNAFLVANLGAFGTNAFTQAVVRGLHSANPIIRQAMQGIAAALHINANTPGYNIGLSFADGLQAGIAAKMTQVAGTAAGMAGAVEAAARNRLIAKSPSKVMMMVGEDTAEGFILGIAAGINKARQAGAALAGAAGSGAASVRTAATVPRAAGPSTLNVTVHNPRPAATETSVHRAMQKIKFHGLLPVEAWGSRGVTGG